MWSESVQRSSWSEGGGGWGVEKQTNTWRIPICLRLNKCWDILSNIISIRYCFNQKTTKEKPNLGKLSQFIALQALCLDLLEE